MSTTSNGSNILAAVGGISLTACVVGVRLVSALTGMGHAHARILDVPHTAAVAQTTPATLVQAPPPAAVPTRRVATMDPTHTVPPAPVTAPAAVSTPAPDQTEVSGGQVTFIHGNPGYRLSYPNDWTVNRAGQEYGVLAPDNNAGVEVSVEDSPAIDTTGLQADLIARLPGFLQQYGGTADSTPQFQTATVDGVQAVVGTLPVTKNGQTGMANVSALCSGGHIYFVVGVIADQTAATAAQDDAEVVTIMDSFHLR